MKNFLKLVSSIILSLILISCGNEGKEQKKIIKLNTSWGENSSVQVSALKFAKLVSEKSKGRYEVKVYPANQLASGNQQTAVEMIQNGDIEASLFGMTVLSFLDDRLAVINMPFMIPSYDVADKLIYNENAKSRVLLDEVMKENGLIPLAYGEAGFRQITNNKREIKSPKDMKGLKFRVLGTCPMFFDLYKALGANPTSINMGEVFTSLQQGVVDGQENAVDTTKSFKLNEVQNYITCWNGVYDSIAFIVSPKFWENLNENDKNLILSCAKQAMKEQRMEQRAQEAKILKEFSDDMTITTEKDIDIAAFKEKVKPVYNQWCEKIGPNVVSAFGDE